MPPTYPFSTFVPVTTISPTSFVCKFKNLPFVIVPIGSFCGFMMLHSVTPTISPAKMPFPFSVSFMSCFVISSICNIAIGSASVDP